MLIFIGGIHGVGKGTLANSLANKMLLKHFTASQILKWEKFSPDVKNKNVKDISETQKSLIQGVESLKKKEESFILDGHFCLFNQDGIPKRVPLETFISISPYLIVVIVDEIRKIRERISSRDGRLYDSDVLEVMQREEIAYSKEVAERLNVPYLIINSSDESAITTIQKHLI